MAKRLGTCPDCLRDKVVISNGNKICDACRDARQEIAEASEPILKFVQPAHGIHAIGGER